MTSALKASEPALIRTLRIRARRASTSQLRLAATVIGLLAIGVMPVTPNGDVDLAVGILAIVALTVACIAALAQARTLFSPAAPEGKKATRRIALSVVGILPVLAVETWFGTADTLAAGDIAPEGGTAWLGRLFVPWSWSGSDLGSPSTPYNLPFAIVLTVVHGFGGTGGLAQRIWYILLFAGCALACFWLLELLGMQPLGAAIGALLFVFNPYSLVNVALNPVFATAQLLVAVVPAVLLGVGLRRLRPWIGAMLLTLMVPLMGFAFSNPPLLIMIATVFVLGVLAALAKGGAGSRRRLGSMLGIAAMAGLLGAAYLVLPVASTVSSAASDSLSPASSWAFTESRATVSNALWLNTTWGWKIQGYFPYATIYDSLVVRFIVYAVPFLAFSSLLLFRPTLGRFRLSLIGASGLVALFVVFLSTGTKAPGNVLFNVLYGLPLGWLLREPGRFLMLATLSYAVLIASTVDALNDKLRLQPPSRRGLALASLLFLLVPAFPLLDGQVAPGARESFPSTRTALPGYWQDLSASLNAGNNKDALLVLPVSDFYQMPADWYYGNTGFITNLLERRVVDPNPQGYAATNGALISTVAQLQQALLSSEWTVADKLLVALHTPEVLVRGDIISNFPGRTIAPPALLQQALNHDPLMAAVERQGPLTVFRRTSPEPTASAVPYATTDSRQPDLRTLALIPHDRAIVTTAPDLGHDRVMTIPAPAWTATLTGSRGHVSLPQGWRWQLVGTGGSGQPTLVGSHEHASPLSGGTSVVAASNGTSLDLRQAAGADLLAAKSNAGLNGCSDRTAAVSMTPPAVSVGPMRALLSIYGSQVCEVSASTWRSGSVLLTADAVTKGGAQGHLCVWQTGPETCMRHLPDLTGGQKRYRALGLPDPGTTKLTLIVTATPHPGGGELDVANVRLRALPAYQPPVAVGTAMVRSDVPRLRTSEDSYSGQWTSPSGAHVLVDGLTNGWLGSSAHDRPRFGPARAYRVAQLLSLMTYIGVAGVLSATTARRLHRKRRSVK